MKKTTFAEENQTSIDDLFTEDFSAPNHLAINENGGLQNKTLPEADSFLDKFLSAIKWIFLFLPGVAALHLAMMGLALMFFYGVIEPFGLLGFLAIGTFLIMLSFGKLQDLKYLKAVLIILAASFSAAVLYDILAIFIKGDFFGFYTRLTFPLIALIGYLAKKSVDNEEKQID
jgi:hypothetical protein